MSHICVGKQTIIGSENGLSPEQHQAIIWINAGILLITPLGAIFIEIVTDIYTFSFKNRKDVSKCRLENGGHLVSATMCLVAALFPYDYMPDEDEVVQS